MAGSTFKVADSRGESLYQYDSSEVSCAGAYLWPALAREIQGLRLAQGARVFDLGCGNGSMSARMHAFGLNVTGVDPSTSGIAYAKANHPQLCVESGNAYDDLASRFGRFPLVVSLEVVEHVFDPRRYARTLFDLVEPGGTAIVSTPYHGYLKNVALAIAGKMDSHFTALWDGGHIKFFSIRTLGILLREAGFTDLSFNRIGRIPVLAKSMMAVARKPKADEPARAER